MKKITGEEQVGLEVNQNEHGLREFKKKMEIWRFLTSQGI